MGPKWCLPINELNSLHSLPYFFVYDKNWYPNLSTPSNEDEIKFKADCVCYPFIIESCLHLKREWNQKHIREWKIGEMVHMGNLL